MCFNHEYKDSKKSLHGVRRYDVAEDIGLKKF